MRKALQETVVHPPVVTVGDLIDQLCRLPDTAAVSFSCPKLNRKFEFSRLRKRTKEVIEIEISPYPESPPIVPSADAAAINSRRKSARSHFDR